MHFLERLALTKFITIPHYAYFVLKMSGSNGVSSIKGGCKCAYDCDRESSEMVDMLLASAKLQQLKKALAESPRTRSCMSPRLPSCPSNRRKSSARQSHSPWMSPLMSLTWGTIWILNRNWCSSNSSRTIGTSLHGSLLTCLEFLVN
jgi:hypothetical protein